MPELTDVTISTGARFIKHVQGTEVFVFEALDGHILRVSIHSNNINKYYSLLGDGATQQGTGKVVGEVNPPNESHEAAHGLGIPYGENHSHWGSRRDSSADGYTILTLLSQTLGSAAWEISDLVKHHT